MNKYTQEKSTLILKKRLKKRLRHEKIFKYFGILSILLACFILGFLLTDIIGKSLPAFNQTYIKLEIDGKLLNENNDPDTSTLFYTKIIRQSFLDIFPDVQYKQDQRILLKILSNNAGYDLQKTISNSKNSLSDKI
ncbi:MAG: DUF3333 domain-containing protein, partial [Alphaproteobacteria bacterium]|nr:DUF3333 domain-containing protein [Alphaproteobacteria bacterium]